MIIPLALVLAAGPAHAADDDGPFMWGVGGTVHTIAVPGRFPASFPDDTGDVLDQTRGDVGLGAHGVLYMDKEQRVGAYLTLGFGGAGFRDGQFLAGYDRILTESSRLGVLAGGAVGAGTMRFGDEDSDAKLKLATYLLRAHIGPVYRHKTMAYEATLYGQFVLNGVETYTTDSGAEEDVNGGSFGHLGVEATVYFGDFKPPSSGKDGGGKKKKKKNKSSGGSLS